MANRNRSRTRFLSVRVTRQEKADLKAAARLTGHETVSELVKATMARVLRRHTRRPAKKAA